MTFDMIINMSKTIHGNEVQQVFIIVQDLQFTSLVVLSIISQIRCCVCHCKGISSPDYQWLHVCFIIYLFSFFSIFQITHLYIVSFIDNYSFRVVAICPYDFIDYSFVSCLLYQWLLICLVLTISVITHLSRAYYINDYSF